MKLVGGNRAEKGAPSSSENWNDRRADPGREDLAGKQRLQFIVVEPGHQVRSLRDKCVWDERGGAHELWGREETHLGGGDENQDCSKTTPTPMKNAGKGGEVSHQFP